jgi:hypothetical protein
MNSKTYIRNLGIRVGENAPDICNNISIVLRFADIGKNVSESFPSY